MAETETRKFIKADGRLVEEIAKKFQVTTRTVWGALSFKRNGPSPRLLRAYALNHGAKLYELRELDNPYKDCKVLDI